MTVRLTNVNEAETVGSSKPQPQGEQMSHNMCAPLRPLTQHIERSRRIDKTVAQARLCTHPITARSPSPFFSHIMYLAVACLVQRLSCKNSLEEMIDPITAISFANECITKCIEIAKIVKKVIEAVKSLRDDLLAIVNRTERTRKVLTIIRSLAQRLQAAGRRDAMFVLDQDACTGVMNKLLELASQMAEARLHNRVVAGIQWWHKYKDESTKLCAAMQEQEDELLEIVELLHMDITLDGLETMQKIRAEIDNQRHVVTAFETVMVDTHSSPQASKGARRSLSQRVWLGYIMKDGLDAEYIRDRESLANAAYIGNWQAVKEYVQHGESRWGETWANAFRLQSRDGLERQSFWTPLHQAVFNNAPLETVQWLLDHGASRTLRTRRSEFDYHDMTPLELARLFGYTQMYDMLRPIVRHVIPYRTLQRVEEQFHTLIKNDLGADRVMERHIRLPEVEVLIESDGDPMWFPVHDHGFENAGYAFRLDGRDLIVLARNITEQNGTREVRITESSTQAVAEALLVNEIAQ